MIAQALALFVASFCFVFLLSIQQLNVASSRYGLAFFTAIAISGSQLVQFKVLPGETNAILIGAFMLGSSLGVIAGMRLHPWVVNAFGAGSDWTASLHNWLGREVDNFAKEEAAKLQAIERDIARDAARHDVETLCKALRLDQHTWYDSHDVVVDESMGADPLDDFERRTVLRAVLYLDGHERLIHHPTIHSLVRFRP